MNAGLHAHLPTPLTRLDRALLRSMERVVPCESREEWTRAWQAELWHARSRRPQGEERPQGEGSTQGGCSTPGGSRTAGLVPELALGLVCDAAWLRTESWRQMLSGTAALCLAMLGGSLLLATWMALAIDGGWQAMVARLSDPFGRFLFEAPTIVLVNFAIASWIDIDRCSKSKTVYWMMRRIFFVAKTALTLLLAFMLSTDMCQPLYGMSRISADLLQTFLFMLFALVGLRWVFRDQQERCMQCLRLLALPAQVGRPTHNLLEWSGTELICRHGHGRLSVPEMETSWCETSRWVDLERGWDEAAEA